MEESPQIKPGSMLLAAIVFEASMGLAAVAGGWITGIPVLLSLKWRLHDLGVAGVALMPMIALFFITMQLKQRQFLEIRSFLQSHFVPLFQDTSILDLFLVSLLSGFAEELLFRGFVQVVVTRYFNVVVGIAVAGIIFGFAHNITRLYMVMAGLMGMYLGVFFHCTGNLAVPVIIHAIYNFFAFLYVVRYLGPIPMSDNHSDPSSHDIPASPASSQSDSERDNDGDNPGE